MLITSKESYLFFTENKKNITFILLTIFQKIIKFFIFVYYFLKNILFTYCFEQHFLRVIYSVNKTT